MINKIELLPFGGRVQNQSRLVLLLRDISFDKIMLYLMALFISRACIMDGLSPFGVAFVAAYLLKYNGGFGIGLITSIGLLTYSGPLSFTYIGTIWILILLKYILRKRMKFNMMTMSFLGLITFLIIKIITILVTDYFLYDLLMSMFEGIIVFSLTYIFTYSLPLLEGDHKRVFTSEEMICGAIMMALTVSGFGSLSIWSLSLKNVVGVFLVILFAYVKGATMGAAVGLTIGVVTAMSTPNMPLVISVYGFSGLLAGLFRDLGKLGSSIGFIIGTGIMSFYINGFSEAIIEFREVFAAAVVLIISANILQQKGSKILQGRLSLTRKDSKDRIKAITHERLKEVSDVFEELSATFERVADKEVIVERKDIATLIDRIVDDVCKACPMYRFCWVNDFYTTYQSIFEIINTIELEGDISGESLPETLTKRCIKPNTIKEKCQYLFDIYKLNYRWARKIQESRHLVSQQLEGVSKIISNLANEVYNDVIFKEDVELEIITVLKQQGFKIKEVTVFETQGGKFEIIIEVMVAVGHQEIDRMIALVSNVVGFKLIKESFDCSPVNNKKYKLKLIKANKYGALTKIAKANKSFDYISGDSYTFGESNNNYYVALSDGMGVGQKANQESDITISLLEKFIEVGFNRELALKTINSILVLKSNDEMLATIDMAVIDMVMGKAQFVKIGAVPTFIKKKDYVEIINSKTLPLGILKDVDFQVFEGDLEDGDLIIMMSDGVFDANRESEDKEEWMAELIRNMNSFNPQVVSNSIIEKTLKLSDDKAKDDMTVLVTKVWKAR